jgi:hypothetical protein
MWRRIPHPRAFSGGRRSGGDSGAQALDATAEHRVLDLGDQDRGRVEGTPVAEIWAQQVRLDRECLPLGALLLLEVPRVPARPVRIRATNLLLVLTVRTLGAQ